MTICDTDRQRALPVTPRHGDGLRRASQRGGQRSSRRSASIPFSSTNPHSTRSCSDTVEWGVDALNRAAKGLKCTTAVHICYGYGIQENIDWKRDARVRMAPVRRDLSSAQHVEDRPGVAGMRQLQGAAGADRICFNRKDVLVGAIDVASLEIETPEQVASTLDAAMEYVDPRADLPLHQLRIGAAAPRCFNRQTARAWRRCARLARKQLKTSKKKIRKSTSGKKRQRRKREEIAASLRLSRAAGKYASITAELRVRSREKLARSADLSWFCIS